jgi:hypothetical protein
MTILERLKTRYGYFGDDEVDEMIEQFGEDYRVGVKFFEHARQLMTLKELKILPNKNPMLNDDIREVFITADEYDRLFGEIK